MAPRRGCGHRARLRDRAGHALAALSVDRGDRCGSGPGQRACRLSRQREAREPSFTVNDMNGKPVRLSSYKARSCCSIPGDLVRSL